MRRRLLLLAVPAAAAGCGFQLRQAPDFAFRTIAMPTVGSPVSIELGRTLRANGAVEVVTSNGPLDGVDAVLQLLAEQREKVVVGLNASGQVREFQLRLRYRFRVRTPQGRELIPETELSQQRDISFNESAVLAKEAEESLLYRDMQNDMVQQVIRRLAAIKTL
jgi:LPS-assembly lipoprotein